MASILSGFEYDVFISYRHNDNRSGWVTEFAKELQEELAATIKTPLTVYFDVNPHDGLLDTHDVDDSLKEKLKCLIFLPIISQTYCDPKSFAWSHEFLVFMKMAGLDAVGLKVRLPNGNVSSRVLPVRIHELDTQDKKVIEAELGPLRAIDFTYHSAGVNRPLRMKDDETAKSVAQNVYRDQINKTANAIKEIIAGLQGNEVSTSSIEDSVKIAPPSNPRVRHKKPFRFPQLKTLFVFSLAVIVALAVALLYTIAPKVPGPMENPGIIRTSVNLPDTAQVSFIAGPLRTGRRAVDISPDGKTIVFVGMDQASISHLYLRPLDREIITRLPGTDNGSSPFFSPDSKQIAFFTDNKLMKISLAEGVVETLAQTANAVDGIWGDDDRIYWLANEGASFNSVDSHGNNNKVYPAGRLGARPISISTDDFIVTTAYNEMRLFSATNGLGKVLLRGSGQALVGNELFFINGTDLFSITFDRTNQTTIGNPRLVEREVSASAYNNSQFAISRDGTLVFVKGPHALMGHLTWRSRTGEISTLPFPNQMFGTFSLSPDERNLAVITRGDEVELWNYRLDDPSRKIRLARNGLSGLRWVPNSEWIYFLAPHDKKPSILKIKSDGRSDAELVMSSDSLRFLSDVNPEQEIIYSISEPEHGGFVDLKVFQPGDVHRYAFRSRKNVSEGLANFMGDGWIAFTADQSGRSEVFISDLLNPSVRIQVSFEGGEEPRYDSARSTLYFRNSGKLMSVPLQLGKSRTATIGTPSAVFEDENWVNVPGHSYAVSADGKRFLIVRNERTKGTREIVVLQNYLISH